MTTAFPGISCARKGGFCVAKNSETRISAVTVRQKRIGSEPVHVTPVEMPKKKLFRADELMKNLGLASALVLCAVTLRTGALPSLDPAADVVLAAATDNSLLDDQLGKLSFVSALFPEAVLVFGESSVQTLSLPADAEEVTHAWSEQEPYTAWRSDGGAVTASVDGEVAGVYHGNGDELIVKISSADGLTCVYGNLENVSVRTGDAVYAGDVIGNLLPGEDFVFEVQRHGVSIDPSAFLTR